MNDLDSGHNYDHLVKNIVMALIGLVLVIAL